MNIIDSHSLLTPAQKQLLQQCASKSFRLEEFISLDDILTQLNVDVIIKPGIEERTTPQFFDDAIEYWEEELAKISNNFSRSENERHNKIKGILEILRGEKYSYGRMPLRGYYDPQKTVIVLFPEEMQMEYGGTRMDELLVSTLAHETMHAYFDRSGHEKFPYVMFVEEPLAEFGQLYYFKKTGSLYYNWAYSDVSNKHTFYRYGADLMDLFQKGRKSIFNLFKRYKIYLNPYSVIDISSGGTIFQGDFNLRRRIPWRRVFSPRYFYDSHNDTLFLDGVWHLGLLPLHEINMIHPYIFSYRFKCDLDGLLYRGGCGIQSIFLGAEFVIEYPSWTPSWSNDELLILLAQAKDIYVHPNNTHYDVVKGVLIDKKTNLPLLPHEGRDSYILIRNRERIFVDANLNEIKRDKVSHF